MFFFNFYKIVLGLYQDLGGSKEQVKPEKKDERQTTKNHSLESEKYAKAFLVPFCLPVVI